MAATIAQQPSKVRWGELEEEEDNEDYAYLLPPRQVIGPDHNGLKKVIEHKFNDEGNKVKITTTSRVRKLANARLSRRAVERRSWPKFGDAVHEDVGARLTMVSTEEILLERPRAAGNFLFFSLSRLFLLNFWCLLFVRVFSLKIRFVYVFMCRIIWSFGCWILYGGLCSFSIRDFGELDV